MRYYIVNIWYNYNEYSSHWIKQNREEYWASFYYVEDVLFVFVWDVGTKRLVGFYDSNYVE